MEQQHPLEIGMRLRSMRERCGLSIRRLAEKADVTAAMISCIERGRNSPSLATMQKILTALGTDMASFFTSDPAPQQGPVFLREKMRHVSDAERSYTIVFPKTPGVDVEMLDEQLSGGQERPPFESLQCTVAGYLLSGSLVLDIKGEPKRILRPGDAFCIPKGVAHRGYAADGEPTRLVTVCSPPRY
ncbi:MAG: hypothetical protein A3K18_21960 [Lentisphaerae bacterium RIFOXYA12_64_32]|nr:MAG: hypothetical protein A3K18_21960 [Lentisphaerae bacterium RIFOXYA12_64_32]